MRLEQMAYPRGDEVVGLKKGGLLNVIVSLGLETIVPMKRIIFK